MKRKRDTRPLQDFNSGASVNGDAGRRADSSRAARSTQPTAEPFAFTDSPISPTREDNVTTPNRRRRSDYTPADTEEPDDTSARIPRPARRRSAQQLMEDEQYEVESVAGIDAEEEALARQIWRQDEEDESGYESATAYLNGPTLSQNGDSEHGDSDPGGESDRELKANPLQTARPEATFKRGRGRPRKPERTPSPPRELAAHERYFFQNRPGGTKTSGHTLANFAPLPHEDYFATLAEIEDPHQNEIEYLEELHARAFAQWIFEMEGGFSICLHGYGSKSKLLGSLATFIYIREAELAAAHEEVAGPVVLLRGFHPSLSINAVFQSLIAAVKGEEAETLTVKPAEAIAHALEFMSSLGPKRRPVTILLDSIESCSSLTTPALFPLLAQLAAHPKVNFLMTTSQPSFGLLLTPELRDQFDLICHDATTFGPYSASELDVVGVVDDLLGRTARKIKGRGGVGYVLKSLTENARRLYAMLVAEQLTILAEVADARGSKTQPGEDDDLLIPSENASAGMEYRAVYRKSVEEFICSNEAAFRTLLKEFHDHQMIDSRREAGGAEVLSIPFRQEELETILEDLT